MLQSSPTLAYACIARRESAGMTFVASLPHQESCLMLVQVEYADLCEAHLDQVNNLHSAIFPVRYQVRL